MSERGSKKPGSLTLRLKEIKIQTGDQEDGHKDIESSVTHLQPGLGLLPRSHVAQGGGGSGRLPALMGRAGQVKFIFSSDIVPISLFPPRYSLCG